MHDLPRGWQAIQLLCRRGLQAWRWYLSHYVPGRDPPWLRQRIFDQKIKNTRKIATLIWSTFSQTPYSPSPYKRWVWDEMLRWFLKTAVLSDHQHLNEVTIKIWSLSLLTGSGSDRQHVRWLFWFQNQEENSRNEVIQLSTALSSS